LLSKGECQCRLAARGRTGNDDERRSRRRHGYRDADSIGTAG
jgi:hypothetical protein